ncbi:MAG: cysteine desulfurase [Rhizobiales bacterium]|nr:cysteine desulfurase [Hyphomicrobiales bacterium]
MTSKRTYFDYNATAPLCVEARTAMAAVEGTFGNPSSVHAEGRAARAMIEDAREQIAGIFQVSPADVIFTSGGTEAAATILSPGTGRRENRDPLSKLLVGATEHDCVLRGHRFAADNVESLKVRQDGILDIDHLSQRIEELGEAHGQASIMVTLQAANNETGILQPLSDVRDVLESSGALLVVDAVQCVGRTALDRDSLPGDVLFMSGHKFGGPKGSGAIVLRREGIEINQMLRGGGQERNQRAGTENPAAIVGFAAALEAAIRDREIVQSRISGLRDTLEAGVLAITPDAVIIGGSVPRLQNTACIAISSLHAETSVIGFDLRGFAVSAGSACSSGKVGASHVLEAMGLEAGLASSAIRVSLGKETSEDEVERFLEAWRDITCSLEERRRGAA